MMNKFKNSVRSTLGFTGVELLLSLVVLTGIIIGIMHFTAKELEPVQGYTTAEDTVDYARAATGFLHTHYMALVDALTDNGDISNGKVITLPPQILRDDGFLPHNYPDINKLKQYPCIVISYGNNQLEAFFILSR
jgi:competence protein ComGC